MVVGGDVWAVVRMVDAASTAPQSLNYGVGGQECHVIAFVEDYPSQDAADAGPA